MAALEENEDFVREKLVIERYTYKQLSDELQQCFPGEKGYSVRSIKRFCSEKGIRKTSDIDQQELDEVVSSAVLQVEASDKLCYACHTYVHALIHCYMIPKDASK